MQHWALQARYVVFCRRLAKSRPEVAGGSGFLSLRYSSMASSTIFAYFAPSFISSTPPGPSVLLKPHNVSHHLQVYQKSSRTSGPSGEQSSDNFLCHPDFRSQPAPVLQLTPLFLVVYVIRCDSRITRYHTVSVFYRIRTKISTFLIIHFKL